MITDMKRFLVLMALLMFPLALLPSPLSASAAAEQYAYIPDADVWFYAGETESSRVFLLPKTYYVKIVGEGEEYCRVEYLVDEAPYKKVTGYCKNDDVIPVDYIPARPYLKKQITLSYSLDGENQGLGGSFSSVEKTFVYYGQRYDGAKLYYYLLSDGVFDYIAAESELAFDLNTDFTDYAQETMAEASGTGAQGGNAAVIAVVCVACVAAVAVAVFVIRGKKQLPPDDQEE